MGQEFHVLRCFTCQSFQVQQVKKVNRWSCKLCGEKQSLLKEFGRGSGADCRRHVQKLNAMRGAMMEEQEQNTWSLWKQMEEKPEKLKDYQVSCTQVSRWSKYLDTPEEKVPEDNVLMDQEHHHGNNRKRKRTESSSTPEQADGFSRASPSPGLSLSPSPGPGCRRTGSLNADCQLKEGEGSMVTTNAPPHNRPRLQLPVSSMFDSGDYFSFDDFNF